MIHDLKNHYYAEHPGTIPATHHQQQRQITNNDNSMAHRQEKPTTSDDSEAEHQEFITGIDGVLTTEEPEQNAGQNKRRASSNDSIENELLNSTCIYFPPPDPQNHFMVQSLDVSVALFNFQRSILNNKWKLTLEDHMHSAMAVHLILFLSMDQHDYDDISTFFNQDMYATIIQTIESTYGIKKPRFPMDTITKILNIIQDASTKIISRDKGIMQLIDLDLSLRETRFVKSTIQLMGTITVVLVQSIIVTAREEYDLYKYLLFYN